MIFEIEETQLHAITGGCGEDSCKDATLNFLNACSMEQMFAINQIFKTILLSDEMKGVDNDTKIAALIEAIQAYAI